MNQPTFHFLIRTDLICVKFFHNLLLKKKFLILTWKINTFLYLQKKVRAPFRCFFAVLYSIIVLIFFPSHNTFFYTQVVFALQFLRDFYIVCNHILVFYFFLLKNSKKKYKKFYVKKWLKTFFIL